MNLGKKKQLAARTLKVGKKRINFSNERLEEIKEAITKQDIKDLKDSGAIKVKEIKGRRKKGRKKGRKGAGKIKKKVDRRKKDYVVMTRKLRAYVKEIKKQGKISLEEVNGLRKRIRNRAFRSKSHLKEYMGELKK